MSLLAILSTVQAYIFPGLTRRIYVVKSYQVTPLSTRTFGTWTLVSSVLRAYAAYRINNPELYALTLANFVISLWHWSTEWLWFGTTGFGVVWPSLAFEISTILWMLNAWGFYIK
jgi:hypothetical protein